MSQRAPDFAEPLLGWRCWRVVERTDGRIALASVVRAVEWPARRELGAECLAARWAWWPRRASRREHHTPERACVCGIYAAANVAQALHYLDVYEGIGRRRPPAVLGIVKLWGTVLECERGWRATYAYPARLFVVAGEARDLHDPHELARGLTRYGVPVDVLVPGEESVTDLLIARRERVEFPTPPLPRGR
jgi:hypothetical protein